MPSPRASKQSKYRSNIWITVFRDGSGGYFSYADMHPEPLAYLVKNPETREQLQQEYQNLLDKVVQEK